MQMDKVELHQAFFWDCPECGLEMFERGVVCENIEEMRGEYGIEPWVEGDFVLMPQEVECKNCHCIFTSIFGEEDCTDD
jgi:hypothetical protein